jgi:N-carbamoyl-L-amino-acid hydrolase
LFAASDRLVGSNHRSHVTITRNAIFFFALLTTFGTDAQPPEIRANSDRTVQRIKALSQYGANADGGVSRVVFSEADIGGREYIMNLMREAGLVVSWDTAANIIGRREGTKPGSAVIMFGSHIDSVPSGGNYDGDVGVIGAIEVAQSLNEGGIRTKHAIEVVSFTD